MFHVEQFRLFPERDDADWWAKSKKHRGDKELQVLTGRQSSRLVTSIRPSLESRDLGEPI